MNLTRVWAIVLRHIFMLMHQLERSTDVFLFPIVGIMLWGFVSNYSGIKVTGLSAFLMGGLILWVVFERVGTSVGIDFMFDIWERNIMNVLASPITIFEFISGLVLVAIVKVLVSLFAMYLVASLFFGFSPASLGVFLVLFWINVVIFAVSLGIFNVSIVIRYGSTIGPLTWILPFVIQPFSAVFYPVSALPQALQKVVWFLPLSHVFEGMRYTIQTGKFNTSEFTAALVLNAVYFVFAVGFFAFMFDLVKKKGTLVKL